MPKAIHRKIAVPRGLPLIGVGDTGPATQTESSGKTLVASIGGAESGALTDHNLALVIANWTKLPIHSQRIIVGMARKALERSMR